ncbi:MAG: 1-acyl-sn-glycerol-3-phosphate acyltransferase [Lachnospiraceae bacterium]|nr:1-acyl-sn-glycerol-3-phosphate acyltransferase [Lachnospiraceae bacterium]
MIRIIITLIFVILFLVLSLVILPVMLLIGLFSKPARDKVSLAIVNSAFRVVLFLAGTKATVLGEENVPKDEAVLYVLNHRSFFDILLTYIRVPRPTGYVAKKEMKNFLTLTWWMMLLHCEFLDRSDIRKGMKTINTCVEKIGRGISIAIYPEGTRNKTEEPLLPFHGGSFKIAEKSNCRIVPVVLNNSSAVLEDHIPFLRSAHVIVEYLPPIDVAGMDREERKALPETVRSKMLEAYLKNKELV